MGSRLKRDALLQAPREAFEFDAATTAAPENEWLWSDVEDSPSTPEDLPQLEECQRELADLLSSLGG